MKILKFKQDNGTLFYKELLSETHAYFQSKNISKNGNPKFWLKTSLYFAICIGLYWSMLHADSKLSFYAFYLLMGISILLIAFNVSHDASHNAATKSTFWNKLLFQISFNLQGNNAYVWGENHTKSHHAYTNIEGSDIDVVKNPLLRLEKSQRLKWYHSYQHIYAPFLYLLYSLNWFLFRETLMLFNVTSRTIKLKIPTLEIIKLVVFKLLYVGYMIVLPWTLTQFDWTTVLTVFILNHFIISIIFVGVLGVSHVTDLVEHLEPSLNGTMNMSWAKLQMSTSVDYHPCSQFLNWTLGGFNAHTLHHLLPHICHVHYPDILPIFRQLACKYNLTYREVTYFESIKAHFRFLKTMGSKNSHI